MRKLLKWLRLSGALALAIMLCMMLTGAEGQIPGRPDPLRLRKMKIQEVTAPSAVPAGWVFLYARSNNGLYAMDEDEVEYDIGTSIWTSNLANFTGTDVNTAQPVFEAARDTITLEANTTYIVEGRYHITTAGTTAHTLALLFGGTATFTDVDLTYTVSDPATDILAAMESIHATDVTATVVSSSLASATFHNCLVNGVIRTNAAGTFIPQYKWSAAPGAAGVVASSSHIKLTKVGTDTTGSNGGWS